MGSPGEGFAPLFRGVDDQGPVAHAPITRLLAVDRVAQVAEVIRGRGVEHRVERVFVYVPADAGAKPPRPLEDASLVVARPGADTSAGDSDVAGEHCHQINGPVVQRGMEVVVDSLTDLEGARLDGGDVVDEALDQISRSARDVDDRVEVIVGEVGPVHLHRRLDLDAGSVGESHRARILQIGVDPLSTEHIADVFAVDGLQLLRCPVKHDPITNRGVLLCSESVNSEARTVGGQSRRVVGEDVFGTQSLQGVEAHQ